MWPARAVLLAHLSQVQLARNQWKAALQSSQEAVALLQALDRPNDLATVHNNWGLVCQEWEQWSDALAHFEQAEVLAFVRPATCAARPRPW